jgi:predicted dehydrogenase
MVEAAKQYGKMLHIQLSRLYRPETRAAKRLIDGGALGRIYHARSVGFRRRGRPYVDGYGTERFVQKKYAGGGAVYDMGVYHISQLLYLMGLPEPQTISGKLYQETGMHEGRRKQSGYDVEELGLGFVRFNNGITMDFFESWAVHMGSMESSSLMGSKGGIRLEPFSYHTTICDVDLDCTGNLDDMDFRWVNTIEDEYAYSSSQAHWIAALKGEVPLLPTAELALSTMLIQEGLYLSDKLGSEVTAQEVIDNSVSTAIEA